MEAARLGNTDIATALLDAGASADWVDDDCQSVLNFAEWAGHTEIVALLLARGATPPPDQEDVDALFQAVEEGSLETVRRVLDSGLDVDATGYDQSWMTALTMAARLGRTDIVTLLLQAGAEVDAASRCDSYAGTTALMAAVAGGHEEIVGILLDAGADVDLAITGDSDIPTGVTALMAAAWLGNEDIARALLDAGADVDAVTHDDYLDNVTALMFAAWQGHTAVVTALLDAGADVDVGTGPGDDGVDIPSGSTALMGADPHGSARARRDCSCRHQCLVRGGCRGFGRGCPSTAWQGRGRRCDRRVTGLCDCTDDRGAERSRRSSHGPPRGRSRCGRSKHWWQLQRLSARHDCADDGGRGGPS